MSPISVPQIVRVSLLRSWSLMVVSSKFHVFCMSLIEAHPAIMSISKSVTVASVFIIILYLVIYTLKIFCSDYSLPLAVCLS